MLDFSAQALQNSTNRSLRGTSGFGDFTNASSLTIKFRNLWGKFKTTLNKFGSSCRHHFLENLRRTRSTHSQGAHFGSSCCRCALSTMRCADLGPSFGRQTFTAMCRTDLGPSFRRGLLTPFTADSPIGQTTSRFTLNPNPALLRFGCFIRVSFFQHRNGGALSIGQQFS